tara:strand:+ start:3928 stop:6720 length:2793 start_codon:yes stop_codon:yes gene_type:complete
MDNTPRKFKNFIHQISVIAISLGILVMIGWFLDISFLKSVLPGYVTMKFNTALGIALSGASLYLVTEIKYENRQHFSKLLAFAVFAIGGLTLLQGTYDIHIGLDQLFITDLDAAAANNPVPGRMSPLSAICFSMMGFSLVFINNPNRSLRFIVQALLNLVTILSFIAILGYLFNVPTSYKLSFLTSMALHTSLAFFIISIAASLLNPSLGITSLFTGSKIGNKMARILYFQLTIMILALGFLRILTHRFNLISVEFGILLFAISFLLSSLFLIWRTSGILNRIAQKRSEAEGSLMKVSSFLNATPDPIVIVNENGKIQVINEQTENVFNYKKEELIGQPIEILLPGRVKMGHISHRKHFTDAPKARTMGAGKQLFALKKGGQEIPVEVSLNPVKMEGEIWVSAAIRDITLQLKLQQEAKQKDQEKLRTEEILDKANEVARIGTWEIDIQSGTIVWSRITREIHEVPADYIPDMTTGINFFKAGDSRNKIQKVVAEAIEKGTPYDLELELVTGKGNTIWARAIGQTEFVDGKCKRLYGVFQDINKIKTTENTLARANEELKAIFNTGSISIIGTHIDGVISHFNRGAEEMLQYSAEEMIGKKTPSAIHLEQEVIQRGEELSSNLGRNITGFDVFVELANQENNETREWTYIRKDGSTVTVLLNVAALGSAKDGEVTGFLGIAIDISERIESQRKLAEAKGRLEILAEKLTAQNTQLASFAHITSHNLRSPVGNLNALLHFYKTSESDEDRELLFEKFEVVIHHLTSTLDSLVEALKIRDEAKKEKENIKFDEVLKKTQEIISAQIMETGAIIKADFSKANQIIYNRNYMESIFLNLLTNAIKYKDPKRVPEIEIWTKTKNKRLFMTVKDNGLGIDLKRHGNRLFGLHKTFHQHKDARGIGLFLTKNHIETMGGTITAESEVGKGTTFTIKF